MQPENTELELLRDFYGKWRHYHDMLNAPEEARKQAGQDLIEAHYQIERFTEPVIIHG